MAEDKSQKTEKPTPKHKRDARRDGRVARSAEIGSWFSLGVVALMLPALGRHAVSEVSGFMSLATNTMADNDPSQSISLLGRGLWTVIEAVGPILFAAAGAAAFAAYGQVGLHISPGALGFKWNKISPTTGVKRIFSARGAWEITKMAFRLIILISVSATRSIATSYRASSGRGPCRSSRPSPRPLTACSVCSGTSSAQPSCWQSPTTPSSVASSTTR